MHPLRADSGPTRLWPLRSGPAGDSDHDSGSDEQIGIATKTRAKPKKPSQFKVLMLTDDYTPMEFVVLCLKRFFHLALELAHRDMPHVQQKTGRASSRESVCQDGILSA